MSDTLPMVVPAEALVAAKSVTDVSSLRATTDSSHASLTSRSDDVAGVEFHRAQALTVARRPVALRPVALRPVALRPVALRAVINGEPADSVRRRAAVALSDWYLRRLTVHRYGSYLMLPLFASEYLLGQRLLAQKDGLYDGTRRVPIDKSLRQTHRVVASSVGALFAINSTTGLWNLWDARADGSTSRRRTLHVLSMPAADAGFAATGFMVNRAVNQRPSDARAHRNVALASMGLATAGVTLMWF